MGGMLTRVANWLAVVMNERYTVCGHWLAQKGTSIMCDCHRRLRLLQSCRSCDTVSDADGAVVGLR